jgi:hypothetical protein
MQTYKITKADLDADNFYTGKASFEGHVEIDADLGWLHVEFIHGGASYVYHDVPASVHADLMKAPSIGQHFHKNIRNAYKFTKVEEPK